MPPPLTLDDVLRDGRNSLNPSLRNPNWLVLRARRRIFQAGLDRLPPGDLSVLDIGGRLQPYRALLGNRVRQYVAVDPQITPLVNVAAIGESLPFRDSQFDFAICTQVLEYFPDPGLATAEIHRVLRKGGVAFFSAPSVFVRDNEKEYWRFLPAGLHYILKDFDAVEVLPEGNSITGLFRTLNMCLVSFAPAILAPVLQWTAVPALNLIASAVEKLGGTNDTFAANFSVWVRR